MKETLHGIIAGEKSVVPVNDSLYFRHKCKLKTQVNDYCFIISTLQKNSILCF